MHVALNTEHTNVLAFELFDIKCQMLKINDPWSTISTISVWDDSQTCVGFLELCVTTVEQTQHLPRSHIVTNILVCYVIYFFAAFGLTEEGHMTCQRSHDLPEVTKQLQTRWDEKHSPYAESTKYTSDINNNKVRVWLLWIDHGWIKFI